MKKNFITVADLGLKMDNLQTPEQKKFMEGIAQTMCSVVNKAMEGTLSKEEVEEQFKDVNEQLKSFDAEKFAQVIKDNEDLCSQVKNLSETITKLQKKGVGMEIVNKFDERVCEMLESEKFKDFVGGKRTASGAFDGFSLKEVSMASNYSGTALTTQQTGVVVSKVANKKSHLRDVIATLQGDPEFPNMAFAQVYDFDRNARFVSENGMLPESSIKVKEVQTATKRLGTYMKISKRMLKSRAYIRSFILNMLPEAVLMAEDYQILFGDGNGENLLGIVNHAGVESIEKIIGTNVFTGAAGSVAKVEKSGSDAVVTFASAHDLLLDGMKITFANATTSKLNATFDVVKMNDKQIMLVGCTLDSNEREDSVAAMTFTVKHGAWKNIDSPNSGDVVKTAFAVMNYAQFSPNAIAMNPITLNAIECEKDTTGRALGLVTRVGGVPYVGGIPVIETTCVLPGKYIVGDFVRGANLVDYTAMSLEWADDVESKLKNQVVLMAQEEVIMPVYMPWAFAYGDLAALKTAITKD